MQVQAELQQSGNRIQQFIGHRELTDGDTGGNPGGRRGMAGYVLDCGKILCDFCGMDMFLQGSVKNACEPLRSS